MLQQHDHLKLFNLIQVHHPPSIHVCMKGVQILSYSSVRDTERFQNKILSHRSTRCRNRDSHLQPHTELLNLKPEAKVRSVGRGLMADRKVHRSFGVKSREWERERNKVDGHIYPHLFMTQRERQDESRHVMVFIKEHPPQEYDRMIFRECSFWHPSCHVRIPIRHPITIHGTLT